MTSLTRPNGTFRTLAYDAAGQLTNIWEQMANGLPIAWFRFNWTNSGNMAWEFAAPLPHTNCAADADNDIRRRQPAGHSERPTIVSVRCGSAT